MKTDLESDKRVKLQNFLNFRISKLNAWDRVHAIRLSSVFTPFPEKERFQAVGLTRCNLCFKNGNKLPCPCDLVVGKNEVDLGLAASNVIILLGTSN